MFNTPMKAVTVENGEYEYPCYASEKYDGWRCLIADGVMYTSGGTPFKPNVQARFKPIIDAGKKDKLIMDGELYFEGEQFGDIASVLSASQEKMAECHLRFYCFDAITLDEWQGRKAKQTFRQRYIKYHMFCGRLNQSYYLFMPVRQKECVCKADAVAFYNEVKERGGEGIILRTPQGLYEPGVRSKDIAKWKVWHTAEAKIVESVSWN